jgi:maleate isomerase
MMRLPGITTHYSRIYTPNRTDVNNDTFRDATGTIADNVMDAVKNVMTMEPDYLVMGMSAITFYGGIKGAHAFREKIEDAAGIGVSTGSFACTAALKAYGGIKRIAFLSPYWPVANEAVREYFTDEGFEVVRDTCLQRTSWLGIAATPHSMLRDAILKVDGPDVDAIVQVGTNASMVKLAAAAEMFLDKPVIAINTATYWHALRTIGIDDKLEGLGRLFKDF